MASSHPNRMRMRRPAARLLSRLRSEADAIVTRRPIGGCASMQKIGHGFCSSRDRDHRAQVGESNGGSAALLHHVTLATDSFPVQPNVIAGSHGGARSAPPRSGVVGLWRGAWPFTCYGSPSSLILLPRGEGELTKRELTVQNL